MAADMLKFFNVNSNQSNIQANTSNVPLRKAVWALKNQSQLGRLSATSNLTSPSQSPQTSLGAA